VTEYGRALADAIEEALPSWVEESVDRVMTASLGSVPPPVAEAARAAGERAAADVGAEIRALLEADIDQQRTTPLAILRAAAVPYPTEVLRRAGAPPTCRDRVAAEMFPDDVYDLTPAAFADISPSLTDVGMAWGAAKAFEHQRRHKDRPESNPL
jgi:hypothetical protein